MKYQLNEVAIANYEGTGDSLLNDGVSLKIAEGETLNGHKWTAWLKAVGEIRGTLKDKNTGEVIEIYNDNINEFFETDEKLSQAEQDGSLNLTSNNWYDLEFVLDGAFVEMTDQDVAFSIKEGIDLLKRTTAETDFIYLLDKEEAELRGYADQAVRWTFSNCDIESEDDLPELFDRNSKIWQAYADMCREVLEAHNGN